MREKKTQNIYERERERKGERKRRKRARERKIERERGDLESHGLYYMNVIMYDLIFSV